MTLTNKILLILLAMTILGAGSFIWYKEKQMAQMQTDIQNSMTAQKQLLDGITRAQSSYVSKDDFTAFANQNKVDLSTIQKDVDTLGATISGINVISVNTKPQNGTNLPSTNTTPSPTSQIPTTNTNSDPFGYLANTQHFELNEVFADNTAVPFGDVGFSASQSKPWSTAIPARSYNVSSVIATNADGKETLYNTFTLTTGGKDYKIKIDKSQFVQQYPSPSLSWFNPRLFLGVSGGVNLSHIPIEGAVSPNVSIGVISYGQSRIAPDWFFGTVGVGYEANRQKAEVELTPFQYNLGNDINKIGLIRNLYVGPNLSVLTDGSFVVGAGLKAGL